MRAENKKGPIDLCEMQEKNMFSAFLTVTPDSNSNEPLWPQQKKTVFLVRDVRD